MGKRLSKIYTRTGDDGTTGLGDGNRISKTAPRVEAMGDVDELNSLIGLMLTESVPEQVRQSLLGVQHGLFDVGGELSLPGYTLMSPDRASALEVILDELNEALAPSKSLSFRVARAAALCHVARSVCRRAERRLCSIDDGHEVNAASVNI